jgi:hypothetical protein
MIKNSKPIDKQSNTTKIHCKICKQVMKRLEVGRWIMWYAWQIKAFQIKNSQGRSSGGVHLVPSICPKLGLLKGTLNQQFCRPKRKIKWTALSKKEPCIRGIALWMVLFWLKCCPSILPSYPINYSCLFFKIIPRTWAAGIVIEPKDFSWNYLEMKKKKLWGRAKCWSYSQCLVWAVADPGNSPFDNQPPIKDIEEFQLGHYN